MAGAGVGHSRDEDAFGAGRAAAQAAVDEAGGAPALAIVYATVLYEHVRLLAGVRSVVGADVPLVGCTTQGISRVGAVDEVDRVVGVAVLTGEDVRVRTAIVPAFHADPRGAGRALADALGPRRADHPVLLWYDPLTGCDVDELLGGLADGGCPQVIGAGAGQTWGPTNRTYQFYGGDVLTGAVVGLALDGVRLMFDLTHGTEPLGLDLEVTEAEGNVIRTIDGRPALEVWSEQLGGTTDNNVDHHAAWALGVQLPDGDAQHYEGPITRAVFHIDADTQTLGLQVAIPTGTRVQLCHRTQEAVHARAVEMAERLRSRLEGARPLLALSFECAARPRPFLGDPGALAEVCTMQAALGPVPWFGLYAWGELAPIGSRTFYHNYTFPLVLVVPE